MSKNVDIISMSWGMDINIPSIESVIEEAYQQGIIMIASASNNGKNKRISFPARLQNVFCIGASDCFGHPAKFNPNAFNPFDIHVEKFSVLGTEVEGADWHECRPDQQPPETHNTLRRRSGTSTATAIATGISALSHEYILQLEDPVRGPENTERLRALFYAMSLGDVGQPYRYLAPWEVINPYASTLPKVGMTNPSI
jgi:hypothetical protein